MTHADKYALDVVTAAVGDEPQAMKAYAGERAERADAQAAHYTNLAACHAHSLELALRSGASDKAIDTIVRDLKKCIPLARAHRQHALALRKLAARQAVTS